jgi:hypothetical protein
MMGYRDSLNLNASTAEDLNRSNAIVNDKETNTPLLRLEKFGFPDITCNKSRARRRKKSKHFQCIENADLRQWQVPSVLVQDRSS